MSTVPTWIEDWLTAGRYLKYLRAAGGSHDRALAMYEWNNDLAAALFRDISHLEIGLRNAYDRALLQHPDVVGNDWLDVDVYRTHLFAPHMAPDNNGQVQDKNSTPRDNIRKARKGCGYDQPGSGTPRGKVIAELMFGFWSYLTDNLHEKTLWVPALHTAYEPGADRARIHAALTELRDLRNRIAHHESVFDRQVEIQRRRVVYVASYLSTDLKDYILDTSKVSELRHAEPLRAPRARGGLATSVWACHTRFTGCVGAPAAPGSAPTRCTPPRRSRRRRRRRGRHRAASVDHRTSPEPRPLRPGQIPRRVARFGPMPASADRVLLFLALQRQISDERAAPLRGGQVGRCWRAPAYGRRPRTGEVARA